MFVDDDMTVCSGFVETHLQAHAEWPGVLAVGAVRLPGTAAATPFGRFRQRLEDFGMPRARGLSTRRNLCSASNMSIGRERLLALGGFDVDLASGEDQELALRHSADGGRITFIPEAEAIHRDEALDIRTYCRRVEWGAEHGVAFVKKQPDWPDNQDRQRVNGSVLLGREPLNLSLRKTCKALLGLRALEECLFTTCSIFERAAPYSVLLDRLYRALLGIHIQRGYRRGLRTLDG